MGMSILDTELAHSESCFKNTRSFGSSSQHVRFCGYISVCSYPLGLIEKT